MRIMRAVPEAEGFALGDAAQELLERPDVRTSGIAGPPSSGEIAGPPAFAFQAHGVTRLLEQVRVSLELGWKRTPQISSLLELMDGTPSEHGAARGSAG